MNSFPLLCYLLSSHIASDPELCYQMTRPWESRPEFLPCLVVYSIAFVVRTGIFHWTVKSNEGMIVHYPNPLSLWVYHLSENQDLSLRKLLRLQI